VPTFLAVHELMTDAFLQTNLKVRI